MTEAEAKKKPQHSGTLYDYPTSELKNLAKEYNLAYYINNIERMTKHQLVEAIRDHMNWKKEQQRLDNAVQFSKTLTHVTKNYDKTRDKASPRIRKNYAELKKESPQLQAKMPLPVPKYKGRKDWLHTVGERVKHVSPTILGEIATAPTPSVSQVLSQFRSMTETQQKQLIASLGLTEAEVLPEGIPALGELEPADEKAVANTVHDVIAEFKKVVMNPEPLVGLVVEPKRDESKLEAFKRKTAEKTPFPADLRAKAYFAGIDSWRYIAIAEALLKRPGMTQQELSNQLKKDGWQVGVSQPNISKLLPSITKLGLLEKPTGTTKAPENTIHKAEEKKKEERTEIAETKEEEPAPEVPKPPVAEGGGFPQTVEEMLALGKKQRADPSVQWPIPPFEPHMKRRKPMGHEVGKEMMEYLEDVRHQLYWVYANEIRQKGYAVNTAKEQLGDGALRVAYKQVLSMLNGFKTMILQPFICVSKVMVAVQATWAGEEFAPGNAENKWEVYWYDENSVFKTIWHRLPADVENGDMTEQIGEVVWNDKSPGGFFISPMEMWEPTERNKKDMLGSRTAPDLKAIFEWLYIRVRKSMKNGWVLLLEDEPVLSFYVTKPEKGVVYIRKGTEGPNMDYKFATEVAYPNELADMPKVPKPRSGGLIIDPVYMSGKHGTFSGQTNPKDYEAIWDNLPNNEKMSSLQAKLRLDTPAEIDKVKEIMRVAQDVSHLLENVNPAEALGWRLIYHEIYEMLERHQGRSPIPATNDPLILQYYPTKKYPDEAEKQQNHAKQIEGMIFKALRGLPPSIIKQFNREAENYRIPTVKEMKKKVDSIKPAGTGPDDKAWYKPFQGKPKKHGLKELFTPA
jgi:hypothetical protein